MKKFMFFALASLLAFVSVKAQDEPCSVPINVAVSDVTANTARVNWLGGEAPTTDGFEGDWDLSFSEGDEMQISIVFSTMFHMLLSAQQQDIDDIDTTISVNGMPVPVSIEQVGADQFTVSGSFDMELGGMVDPIQFHFSTTGTLGTNGLSIEPATISESTMIMGQLPLEFTGSVTFVQPTALPTNGILTIEIATIQVNGNSDLSVSGMSLPNAITVVLTGTQLHATGSLAIPGVEGYEIQLINTVTGEEEIVASNYSHYLFYDLESETEYTVAIRTICSGGTYSDWSAAVPFTTLEGSDYPCDTPTDVAVDQESQDIPFSALITWEGEASEYDVQITSGGQPATFTTDANSYNFQGVASMTYSVRVRAVCDGGFTSGWSAPVTFNTPAAPQPQGIGDVMNTASESCSIYPNPATSRATVSVEGLSGKAQLSVIDMSGRTVMTSTIDGGSAQLNVSKLAKGTYFVRISGDQISTVRKLIVK